MAANELFAQLHEAAQTPRKQLDKYLAEGRKVVAVAPVLHPAGDHSFYGTGSNGCVGSGYGDQ